MIFRLLVLACAVSMTLTAGRAGAEAIVVDGQVPPFRVWHVLKMPGETLDLKIPEGLIARVDGAVVVSSWRAPDTPGNHTLVIASAAIRKRRRPASSGSRRATTTCRSRRR